MANAQLTLVPVHADWKLDEETKRIGRAGLAQARAALAETTSPELLSPAGFDVALVETSDRSRPVPASVEAFPFGNDGLLAA